MKLQLYQIGLLIPTIKNRRTLYSAVSVLCRQRDWRSAVRISVGAIDFIFFKTFKLLLGPI